MSEEFYRSNYSPGGLTHNRKFSEMSMKSSGYLSDAKTSLDKAYRSLKSTDKLIDFNYSVNRKNSYTNRVTFSDLKSESTYTAFKTNYKTKFPRYKSYDKDMKYNYDNTPANFLAENNENSASINKKKIDFPLKSHSYFYSEDKRIEYIPSSMAKHLSHTKTDSMPNPLLKKNSSTKFLPSLWKSELKIKEQIMNTVREKFSRDTDEDFLEKSPQYFKKSNNSLSEYLNFKKVNPYVLYSGKTEADDLENKLTGDGEGSRKIKIKTSVLKNLKSTFNVKKEKENENEKIKSNFIKLNKRKELEKIDPSDFETGSEYLNTIQRNIQINFQRKYPEYKMIKQNESQLKINEAISIPDFQSGIRTNLAIKKPFFHINKNICFPLFVKDRHMLLKIHKKNMRSLETKLFQFSE